MFVYFLLVIVSLVVSTVQLMAWKRLISEVTYYMSAHSLSEFSSLLCMVLKAMCLHVQNVNLVA